MARIIIIEDEISIRNVLKNILVDENKNYKIDGPAASNHDEWKCKNGKWDKNRKPKCKRLSKSLAP